MAVRPNQNRKREVAPLGISPPMPAHSPLFSAPLMLANGGKIALADDPLASLFLAEGGAVQSGFRGSIIEPSNFQTTAKSLLGNNRTIGTGLRGKSDGFGFRERLPEPEIPISSPQDPLAPTLVVPLTTTVATPTTPNTPIQDSGDSDHSTAGDPYGGSGGMDIGDPSHGDPNAGIDGPGGESGGGGGGCVIATHGVFTGGFTVLPSLFESEIRELSSRIILSVPLVSRANSSFPEL